MTIEIPQFQGLVDTEQTLTRDIPLINAGDARFDVPVSYRSGSFRPLSIKLHYRVNRGATSPYWYLFSAKIRAAKVLKDGRVSTAYSNTVSASYAPENLPDWAREMGAQLKPVVDVERRGFAGV